MRKAITAMLAVTAAVPLALLSAAPASAAPGDVTAEFTTTPNLGGGNTVTGTFTVTGRGGFLEFCGMVDFGRPDGKGGYLLDAKVAFPGSSGVSKITATDHDVPDDTYTVEWYCTLTSGGYDGTTEIEGPEYSAPTTLVVPAVVPQVPEVPRPGCIGLFCLSTGSFSL